jgi:hypothetical protein
MEKMLAFDGTVVDFVKLWVLNDHGWWILRFDTSLRAHDSLSS